MQNIYKSSPKIRIRWLSQKDEEGKEADPKGTIYSPDFYDTTGEFLVFKFVAHLENQEILFLWNSHEKNLRF